MSNQNDKNIDGKKYEIKSSDLDALRGGELLSGLNELLKKVAPELLGESGLDEAGIKALLKYANSPLAQKQRAKLNAEVESEIDSADPTFFGDTKADLTKDQGEDDADFYSSLAPNDRAPYTLSFPGKIAARTATRDAGLGKALLYDKERSHKSENTENLYIAGDNLDALALLLKSYRNQIAMIYIDPPYNTGNEFVYNDNFKEDAKDFGIASGSADSLGRRYSVNKKENGHFHSRWLSMMLPRLTLARELLRSGGDALGSEPRAFARGEALSVPSTQANGLGRSVAKSAEGTKTNGGGGETSSVSSNGAVESKSDSTPSGVIFISIDEHEITNLRKLCDEVFGEENFVSDFVRKTKSTTNDAKTGINYQHEYVLCYAKNIALVDLLGGEKDLSKYKNPDNDPNGRWVIADPSAKSGSEKMNFPITNPYTGKVDYPPEGMYWRFSETRIPEMVESGKIAFKKSHKENERGFIYKRYADELKTTKQTFDSLCFTDNEFMNQNATKHLKAMKLVEYFQYPKGVNLVEKMLLHATEPNSNDIILDFFSGSATTGDAVMRLNAKDGGNRHYILVQIEEALDSKSAAAKAGYKSIVDIGQERLRRAGDAIKNEVAKNDSTVESELLDTGFKAFRVSTSCLNAKEEIKDGRLKFFAEGVRAGVTELELAYELVNNEGSLPFYMEEISSHGYTYYKIHHGLSRAEALENIEQNIPSPSVIILALAPSIPSEVIDELGSLENDAVKIIFTESAFDNSSVKKVNALGRLENKAEIRCI